MRNLLLSAVSVLALAISGAAYAGQTATESSQDQATQTTTEQSTMQSGTTQDNAATQDSAASQDSAADSSATEGQATTDQSTAQSGTEQDGTVQSSESQDTAAGSSESTEGTAAATSLDLDGERYGSYQAAPDNFSGEIAGGYMADDLIGKSLVDASGDSVGEVNDLLIGGDNRIEKVLVDVGGFLGLGERRVALDIEELQLSEDGNFMTAKTEEELENMPEYDQFDAEWGQRPAE